MPNFNRVILVGHVVRDAEVKKVKDTTITRFSIATNRNYQRNGEWQSEPMYIDIDTFGKTAERSGEIAKKGAALLVEGEIAMDTWEDKNTGARRTKHLVRASKVSAMSKQERGQRDYDNSPEPAETVESVVAAADEWDAGF